MAALELYETRRATRCPLCGSTDITIDYQRGMLVCRSCGAVLEEELLDFSVPYSTVEAPRAPGRSRMAERRIRIESGLEDASSVYKLAKLIGDDAVALIETQLASRRPGELLALLRGNRCLRRLLRRMNGGEAAAALYAAAAMSEGEAVLPSELEAFGIDRRTAKRIIAVVDRCLRGSRRCSSNSLLAAPLA